MRLFDLHCDTLYEALMQKKPLMRNDLQLSFARGGCFSPWVQTLAVWIPDRLRGEAAFALFARAAEYLQQQLSEMPARFCREPADFTCVQEEKGLGVMLAVEGGAVLGGKIENIEKLARRGVRMLTLTWNGPNELGGGALDEEKRGLTPFGRAALAEMERHGIVVDLSHACDRLFEDVLAASSRPVVATHSNPRAVCGHARNLTDAQFAAIAGRGGLVGLNFYPAFVTGGEDASFDDLYRHIEHFWALGGENILAIGSDFDGAQMPSCLQGVEALPAFYEFLLSKNIHESLVDRLFFGNAYDFFAKL